MRNNSEYKERHIMEGLYQLFWISALGNCINKQSFYNAASTR
ncbi:MAG: hypothetical protein RL065_2170 [Bacteroidota bacterium]